MKLVIILALAAIAVLWRRVRKLERDLAVLAEQPAPGATTDLDVRVKLLEQSARQRALEDATS